MGKRRIAARGNSQGATWKETENRKKYLSRYPLYNLWIIVIKLLFIFQGKKKQKEEDENISTQDKHQLFESAFTLLVAMLENYEVI